MDKNFGIYKLEFEDGSYYIGQSVNLNKRSRYKDHVTMMLNNRHHSYKVQDKFDSLQKLPTYGVVEYSDLINLNSLEQKYINLNDKNCLNVKAGGGSNYGQNTDTAKYFTYQIEDAFFLLINNPKILHKEVATHTGLDINTVHDISAGRSRAVTEMSIKYPEEYAKLLKMKAHNTRGKTTVILANNKSNKEVTLVTGEYSQFCRDNNIQSSNLAKVITGKRNSTMGWYLVSKYENI